MIPTRLTGRPSWDVEYYQTPSLTTAYIHAAKYFGIDGWMFNGDMRFERRKMEEFGYYPPDMDRIQAEIQRLETQERKQE